MQISHQVKYWPSGASPPVASRYIAQTIIIGLSRFGSVIFRLNISTYMRPTLGMLNRALLSATDKINCTKMTKEVPKIENIQQSGFACGHPPYY